MSPLPYPPASQVREQAEQLTRLPHLHRQLLQHRQPCLKLSFQKHQQAGLGQCYLLPGGAPSAGRRSRRSRNCCRRCCRGRVEGCGGGRGGPVAGAWWGGGAGRAWLAVGVGGAAGDEVQGLVKPLVLEQLTNL